MTAHAAFSGGGSGPEDSSSGPGGGGRAFELGVDLAAAEGAVVFQNDLMQLIQYAPSTKTAAKRPVLIVPPWTGKYYVLDLRPENSFIKWTVDQGLTVFVISWVNPDESLAHKTFDDYLLEGPIAALRAVEQAAGAPEADVVGCGCGGALAVSALARLAAQGEKRAATLTLPAARPDFEDAGDIIAFAGGELPEFFKEYMEQKAAPAAADMFSLLWGADFLWSFMAEAYLAGQTPAALDLLHWSADSPRIPQKMHNFYLREIRADGNPPEIDIPVYAGDGGPLKDAWTHEGAWRTHWRTWLASHAAPGATVRARIPGDGALPVIEPAPGSYVRVRSDA